MIYKRLFSGCFKTDKEFDSNGFMASANEFGEQIATFFVKVFMIALPVSLFCEAIATLIYSYHVYGYANNAVLYRPYLFSYVLDFDIKSNTIFYSN